MAELKVNLGCGRDIRAGWRNIEQRDLPGAERGDVRDLQALGIEPGSVDYILAGAILEHMKLAEWKSVLAHWIDCLKVGGTLEIHIPDLRLMCSRFLSGKLADEEFVHLMYGGQNYEGNFHRSGASAKTLFAELAANHCEVVRHEQRHHLLLVWTVKRGERG